MSQPALGHGVFYLGKFLMVEEYERNGFKNCNLVLIREGQSQTDKISLSPDSEAYAQSKSLSAGDEVWVSVIPARQRTSRQGKTYTASPFALNILRAE